MLNNGKVKFRPSPPLPKYEFLFTLNNQIKSFILLREREKMKQCCKKFEMLLEYTYILKISVGDLALFSPTPSSWEPFFYKFLLTSSGSLLGIFTGFGSLYFYLLAPPPYKKTRLWLSNTVINPSIY